MNLETMSEGLCNHLFQFICAGVPYGPHVLIFISAILLRAFTVHPCLHATLHSKCIVCLFVFLETSTRVLPLHSSKSSPNPHFIEKPRCLSSVSLFFCRKALDLLTSSPLPSFLLSEGTHLKKWEQSDCSCSLS